MKKTVLFLFLMMGCGSEKPETVVAWNVPQEQPTPPTVIYEPEDPPVDDSIPFDDGEALFEANCSSCHSEGELAGVSPAQIQNALRNVRAMRSVKVTPNEVASISEYLSSGNPGGQPGGDDDDDGGEDDDGDDDDDGD